MRKQEAASLYAVCIVEMETLLKTRMMLLGVVGLLLGLFLGLLFCSLLALSLLEELLVLLLGLQECVLEEIGICDALDSISVFSE